MNVSDVSKTQALLQALQPQNSTQEELQVGMLKKTLGSQKDEASQLLKMLQGKGQIIDIRV
jgi:hypothetical protein